LWQSVPFNDADAWKDWLVHHALWHRALAKVTKSAVLNYDDLKVEMLRHAEIHVADAKALGIQPAFDLAGFDLKDRSSYYSFMVTHAQDTQRLNRAAGI
jgi:hypothetical protein